MGSEREKYPGKNKTNEKSEQVIHAAKGIGKCESEPVLFSDSDEILTIEKHISKLKEEVIEIIEEREEVSSPAACIIQIKNKKGNITDFPTYSVIQDSPDLKENIYFLETARAANKKHEKGFIVKETEIPGTAENYEICKSPSEYELINPLNQTVKDEKSKYAIVEETNQIQHNEAASSKLDQLCQKINSERNAG